ncbi:L,D-transpeptidase family protein [Terrarubrum flagellatum]|uniref:L,D-transpeptidase family protein n=1 Tax=Terrirubrum flagellatum TaxID=2895980 RepID=UPI003144FABB
MTRTAYAWRPAAILVSLALTTGAARAVEPMYGPQTHDRTASALAQYQAIAARGGWSMLPSSTRELRPGATGAEVAALHQRLAVTGDIDATLATSDQFNDATIEGLRKFQARHGLSLTGSVGTLTLRALNTPVDVRVKQLAASLDRLKNSSFAFGARYVVVNIPGAAAEAVENGQVAQAHTAVVGRPDRASPVLEARITAVNLNPTWTAPTTIVKNDIIPKVAKDAGYLEKNHMRLIGAGGAEIDPKTIDWNNTSSVPFSVRQDAGPTNSLGQLRIDMPNAQAVYMHDTPKKDLFRSDVRFHSSGCARIQDVRDLAAWLLEGTGVDRIAIETGIESAETKTIRLAHSVPVAWIYLTAWGSGDGAVQFREDIYKLDGAPKDPAASTLVARTKAPGVDMMTTGSVPAKPKPAKALVVGAANTEEPR